MITTKKQIKLFEATCKLWQSRLGLTQYFISFEYKDLGNDNSGDIIFGNLNVNEMGKIVTISLLNDYPKNFKEDFDVEQIARHEMLHLLTQRLYWLGINRYLNPSDLIEEWEAVTVRLENYIGANDV